MSFFLQHVQQFVKRHWKKIVSVAAAVVLLLSVLTIYANKTILAYESYIVEDVGTLSDYPIAIVLGGGMADEHTMSDMQRDRVMKGLELYTSGKVLGLLLSGDDGSRRAPEIQAMTAMAKQYGVADDRLLIDDEGFRTYLTCRNAVRDFHVTKAVVISQRFHLPRILYICRSMGIDVVGVAADVGQYENTWTPGVRETMARAKAFVEVLVRKPWFDRNVNVGAAGNVSTEVISNSVTQ